MTTDIETNEFQLPIYYLDDKIPIEEHTITDLELKETESTSSLYNYVFNPNIDYAKSTIPLWSEYYTANK